MLAGKKKNREWDRETSTFKRRWIFFPKKFLGFEKTDSDEAMY